MLEYIKSNFSSFSEKQIRIFSVAVIILFSLLPLLFHLPYRVNIYVIWEGAYRMYLGQLPYRDFGMPIGYGFWILPFIFFKIFGPYMISLIKAQVFINIVSLLIFRLILRLFNLKEGVIFLSILVMCLSFVMINSWPWYNHSVFFYGLVASYFVLYYLIRRKTWIYLSIGALFTGLAIMTKQDGGGLTLLLITGIIIIDTLFTKEWKPILLFTLSFIIILAILIIPFLQYEFNYWFNYGQLPHYSRINGFDFIQDIFSRSGWIKGYFLAVVIVLFIRFSSIKELLLDKNYVLFTTFTLGILIQAMIIQVTSFSPATVNLYFHSFAVAFILFNIQDKISLNRSTILVILTIGVFFWKSENYWKYSQKIFTKLIPTAFSPPPANVVSKGNWAPKDSTVIKPVIWRLTDIESLKGIKLPQNTIEGINYLINLDIEKRENDLKVLNMSNLTPLAYEIPYVPEKGKDFPLWYHKRVALFDREVNMLCQKIDHQYYDLIIFENMPNVDGFFPNEVRVCIKGKYRLVNKFLSPTGYVSDSVEVYIRYD